MSADATPPLDPVPAGAGAGSDGGDSGESSGGANATAKRAAQGIALLIVAGLLGLLIWQVAHRNTGGAAAKLNASDGAPVPAPAFSLPRITGIPGTPPGTGPISLASLHGKVIVLNFWASWCIPCKQESPRMQEAYLKYRDQGVVVLGVDAQDFTGDARNFAKKYGLTYPMIHDGSGAMLNPYGVTGFPETFFVDRKGNLVGKRIEGEISAELLDQGIKRALAT